jgi:hypothetical protein
MKLRRQNATMIVLGLAAVLMGAQTAYQPKFPGDPARSDSEAGALGYMRTVLRAQNQYKKKTGNYATSLAALVGGARSFTRRMVNPDRGDYRVGFKSHKDGFDLTLTPKQLDPEHRSFYAAEDGIIRVEETKAANENSPPVR